MKFIKKPNKNRIWLAIQDNLNSFFLKQQILNSDICISDLDDTDVPSSAKKLVYDSLRSIRILNPKFLSWYLRTGYKLLKKGKTAESETGKEYIELFLRNPRELERVKAKFTNERIQHWLYPGIQELYRTLPAKMYKIYFTRNIMELGETFARFLGFNQVIPEVFDKEKTTVQFIETHSQFKRYFVKGDSQEDEAILEALEFYKEKGKIESIISCYRADSPNKMNKRFTVNLGKNYFALVEILKRRF